MLNPDKFQFAERSVDFPGLRVSDSTIEPLPKYLDAIKDFPSPTSTTNIRSWFGFVNQVSNLMAPFKSFLSPRGKFVWSPELEEAFQTSKEAIVEAIRQGVEISDIQRRTCLRPDFRNTTVAPPVFQTAGPRAGESHWPVPACRTLRSSTTQLLKEKPSPWPGA